jgi:hypothetical protein
VLIAMHLNIVLHWLWFYVWYKLPSWNYFFCVSHPFLEIEEENWIFALCERLPLIHWLLFIIYIGLRMRNKSRLSHSGWIYQALLMIAACWYAVYIPVYFIYSL